MPPRKIYSRGVGKPYISAAVLRDLFQNTQKYQVYKAREGVGALTAGPLPNRLNGLPSSIGENDVEHSKITAVCRACRLLGHCRKPERERRRSCPGPPSYPGIFGGTS